MEDDRFLVWSKSIVKGNGLSAHGDLGLSVGVGTGGVVLDLMRFSESFRSAVRGRGGDVWRPDSEGGLSRLWLVTAGMLENRERSWLAVVARKGSSPGLEGPSEKPEERRPMDSRGARYPSR